MKLIWSDAALADIDRFANFLRREHPSLAVVVGEEIVARAEVLSEHPEMGRALPRSRFYRQIVLQIHCAAYVFQYRYDGKSLVMLRVFHERETRE